MENKNQEDVSSANKKVTWLGIARKLVIKIFYFYPVLGSN